MVQLGQIETFVKIGEQRSLAEVGRILGRSSAAVSKQMTLLETELGVQLLMRSTRKVELTDLGKAYWEQCRRVLEEVEGAQTLVTEMKQVPCGELRVFSQPYFTARFITPHLPEFLSLYPRVAFQLKISETLPHFDQERVDLLIGASASPSDEVIQRSVANTHYEICAAPSYLEAFGTPQHPEELKAHRCIAHSGRRPMNRFYGQKGEDVEFVPYMSVNDVETLVHLATLGVGIVQLHHYAVREAIASGKLVPLLSGFTKRDVPIYLALPPKRFTPSKVRCFIDFILEKMRGETL